MWPGIGGKGGVSDKEPTGVKAKELFHTVDYGGFGGTGIRGVT